LIPDVFLAAVFFAAFFVAGFLAAMSEHLRCQRDDAHVSLIAQLTAHGTENTGAARFAVGSEDHRGVLVKFDIGTVGATPLLIGAHDHRGHHFAAFDVAAGNSVFHRGHDGIANAGVPPAGSTQNPDTQDLLGSGVVGDLQPRLLLNHRISYLAFSRTSTTRQRFVADNGRVSMSMTRSPTPACSASSWALSLTLRLSTLP